MSLDDWAEDQLEEVLDQQRRDMASMHAAKSPAGKLLATLFGLALVGGMVALVIWVLMGGLD